jgi:phage FluMu gp28-like protein
LLVSLITLLPYQRRWLADRSRFKVGMFARKTGKTFTASRVNGLLMTAAHKLDIASRGKGRFEDRKLRIAAGDLALRSDLHKPQRVVGPTGLVRFLAERDVDGHADRFWALMLAFAAADVATREYAYTPVPRAKRPRVHTFSESSKEQVLSGRRTLRGCPAGKSAGLRRCLGETV